jgi:uncharacterized protein YndB with AHSA1/START domain
MRDIVNEINAVHRQTGRRAISAGEVRTVEVRTVEVRRSYDAPIEDVWDAITNPERINRWFLPISGDLRLGGTYQLEGNAGGEILRCEAPHLLKVTWVLGAKASEDDISEVEVRLSPGPNGQTVFELEHIAVVPPDWWAQYGPGAVGVGWDLVLVGLGLHLRGEHIEDPSAWAQTPEARQFMTESSNAWGSALAAAGATDGEVATAIKNTTDFYAPTPAEAQDENAGT